MSRKTPPQPRGAGVLIYLVISLGITAAVLVLALQFRGPISALFGITMADQRCSGSVNRWANRRLDSYRQELEAKQHGKQQRQQEQNAAYPNIGISLINGFDRLLTERMLDQHREDIINTTLRTSRCRPVFQ